MRGRRRREGERLPIICPTYFPFHFLTSRSLALASSVPHAQLVFRPSAFSSSLPLPSPPSTQTSTRCSFFFLALLLLILFQRPRRERSSSSITTSSSSSSFSFSLHLVYVLSINGTLTVTDTRTKRDFTLPLFQSINVINSVNYIDHFHQLFEETN